jgi:hypothetical protein
MACDYGVALELFQEDRWAPYDQTRSFWYEAAGSFYYSENDEASDPEEWDGGGYSSERVRCRVIKGDFILVTLDDDCGGQFQAIFSLDKELKDE